SHRHLLRIIAVMIRFRTPINCYIDHSDLHSFPTRRSSDLPLAYMRGRTLESAFVILDEAQNTTPEQMKMFLTRLGMNSKAVVNRSEEHTSELQSRENLVCRLLLEKKKNHHAMLTIT